MRKLLQMLLPVGMLVLTGCGDAVAEDPVDTTLPNGTTAIASTTADMTGALNATEDMDTMSENMTAIDDPYPPTLDDMTDPYATAIPDQEARSSDGDLDTRTDETVADPDPTLTTTITNAM